MTEIDQDIDYDAIISQYRADPFEYQEVRTRHTGRIRFHVEEDAVVEPLSGEWQHIPGTLLYQIERERNLKSEHAPTNGIVASVRRELEGQFVESGEVVMTIKHPLKKREIIESILRKVLFIFTAPERARYFFSLDIQARIEKFGQRVVAIRSGDEILTMSLMKRDTPVYYEGEPGIIHSVYFQPGDTIQQGAPVIGVCPNEKLTLIQKIINRVKAEWD